MIRQSCHSALKVVKSASRYAETARDEIRLLRKVMAANPSHPGRDYIVSYLDSFQHVGPEETHICMVFEPLGENLLALIERNKAKGVPRSLVKAIAKQIILGLQYLHDECDLVHTDIKPENISECRCCLLRMLTGTSMLTLPHSDCHPRRGDCSSSRTFLVPLANLPTRRSAPRQVAYEWRLNTEERPRTPCADFRFAAASEPESE